MKKLISWILTLIFILSLAGCNTQNPDNNPSSVPEDFSFSLVWNGCGLSSYDSQTGKLIKIKDVPNPEDYTVQCELTREEKEYVYSLIASLDINSYPDEFDPQNGNSKPRMSLILTVRMNGEIKTVKAEGIAISFASHDEKGQKFLSVCEAIAEMLTETDEWKALPDYAQLYD